MSASLPKPYNLMTPSERRETLVTFEKKFHTAIWDWMVYKLEHPEDWGVFGTGDKKKGATGEAEKVPVKWLGTERLQHLRIMDISEDACAFSSLLAQRYKAEMVTCVCRPEIADFVDTVDNMKVVQVNIADRDYGALSQLGQHDIIVLKEVLYLVVNDLAGFLSGIKQNLAPGGLIFIVTRPKNPPLPVPNEAMVMWRKMAPSREQVVEALAKAGYKNDTYVSSGPVTVSRNDWGAILKSGLLPPVKNEPKCTDRAIKEFVDSRQAQMKFEERLFLFAAWVPGQQDNE